MPVFEPSRSDAEALRAAELGEGAACWVSDVSTANGLDSDSLSRAMAMTRPLFTVPNAPAGGLPVPLPVLDRA